MYKWFKRFRQLTEDSRIEDDLTSRKVRLVAFTFTTILGEVVQTENWTRINDTEEGLRTAGKRLLLPKAIHIGNSTYLTNHIVSLTYEVIGEGFIRPSVKKDLGGYAHTPYEMWHYRSFFTSSEVEHTSFSKPQALVGHN